MFTYCCRPTPASAARDSASAECRSWAAGSSHWLGTPFTAASLDDPRCLQQYRGRDGEPERFGGSEIDLQVEREGILDRKIAGACALQDLVDVERGPAEVVRGSRSIGGEDAGFGKSELEHAG